MTKARCCVSAVSTTPYGIGTPLTAAMKTGRVAAIRSILSGETLPVGRQTACAIGRKSFISTASVSTWEPYWDANPISNRMAVFSKSCIKTRFWPVWSWLSKHGTSARAAITWVISRNLLPNGTAVSAMICARFGHGKAAIWAHLPNVWPGHPIFSTTAAAIRLPASTSSLHTTASLCAIWSAITKNTTKPTVKTTATGIMKTSATTTA